LECKYDPDHATIPEDEQPQKLPNESDDDYWDRRDQWERAIRRVIKPQLAQFKVPEENLNKVDLRTNAGLQIIVKFI
jgi:hypothetical protein